MTQAPVEKTNNDQDIEMNDGAEEQVADDAIGSANPTSSFGQYLKMTFNKNVEMLIFERKNNKDD